MIVGFLRLAVFGFIGLTVVYLMVAWYSRSVRREALEKRWDEGDIEGDRAAYVEEGLRAYEQGLRRKLIVLVYVIPSVVLLALVYILNYT